MPPPPVVAPRANAPRANAALGIVAVVLAALTLVPIGLAIWNVVQAIRMGSDTIIPAFMKAIFVQASGTRVVAFSLLAALLAIGAAVLGLVGRRSLVAKAALGFASLELVSVMAVGMIASQKMPSAANLRAQAAAERAADEAALLAPAPTTAKPVTAPEPAVSDREVAFQLGLVLGNTVLARTNGAPPDAVERQRQRAVSLAHALGLEVAPYPPLTGRKLDDVAAGMDYLLEGSGKDAVARVRTSRGEREASLLELGMKMGVMRFMYMPKGKLNSAFISVLNRTAKTAQLETDAPRAVAMKMKANAPRTDVYSAIDAMETAIKNELAAAGSAPKPVVQPSTMSIKALPSAAPSAAPSHAAAKSRESSMSIREVTPSTKGGLPAADVQRIVRAHMGSIRACYEKGLASNPSLEGRVAVKFVIDRSGRVAVAQDDGSTLPDASVVQCVIRGYGAMTFPAPEDGGIVTVRYPLELHPAR